MPGTQLLFLTHETSVRLHVDFGKIHSYITAILGSSNTEVRLLEDRA